MSAETRENLTFEESLVELENIVRALEGGQTGLEESLARYEQGVTLLRRCYGQLQTVEKRIQELQGQDAAGNPLLAPFDHAPSIEKKT